MDTIVKIEGELPELIPAGRMAFGDFARMKTPFGDQIILCVGLGFVSLDGYTSWAADNFAHQFVEPLPEGTVIRITTGKFNGDHRG